MNEESFVVKVRELFQISRKSKENAELFDEDIKGYVIPMYQREYKWTEDKVQTFIRDINDRDKFLGNLILDKKNDTYEITDGQQRVTTLMLILAAVFNHVAEDDQESINQEQEFLLQHIMKNHEFILTNDTVGKFLRLKGNQIELDIPETTDVYFQKKTFEKTYDVIKEELIKIVNIKGFINKLLDCKLCILICKDLGETESVERIFLDMNFKLQKLDVEDIFKGYCFQNYRVNFHDELKASWVELKQYSRIFKEWGYEDFSEFLYHYFLSGREKNSITKSLTVKGTGLHYLDGKTGTQTEKLLKDMSCYAKNLYVFGTNLKLTDYKFEDICPDSEKYNTNDYIVLKELCRSMVEIKTVQYHKLPFLMLINNLYKKEQLRSELDYDTLKRMITNYFIYSFLFINSRERKKRESIDETLFNVLDSDTLNVAELRTTIVALRKKQMGSFEFPRLFVINKFYILYSIMDNYDASQNYINKWYSLKNAYNQEHLIVHDNRRVEVEWWDEEKCVGKFSLSEVEEIRELKKYSLNYLIIEEELNKELGIKDIVKKVDLIEKHFSELPKHIGLIISFIKELDSFKALKALKGQAVELEQIQGNYIQFINEYFSEENKENYLKLMEKQFMDSFRN